MNNSPYCANCRLHGWKQLEDTSQLKRCKNCKVVQYCGEDCQREHWKKVHREQCDHFVNQDWGHKEADCQTCCKVAAVGKSKLKKPNNPDYECIFKEYNFPPSSCHPRPFPITGQRGDIKEKAIIVLWQLLHKFAIIHPKVVRDFRNEVDKAFVGLKDIVLSVWEMRKDFTHPEKMIKDIDELIIDLTNLEGVMEALGTINEAVKKGRPVVDPFQLWNVIMLVRRVLHANFNNINLNTFKDLQADMPDELKEIVSQGLESQDKFLAASDQILSALATKVIPFQQVLKIICGGTLNQNCHFCEKEIVIAHVNVNGIDPIVLGGPAVFFGPFTMGIYCCGIGDCIDKEVALWKDWRQFKCAVGTTFMERVEIRCDFCFQLPPKNGVHRCSGCFTVMYCSQTCGDQDLKIHKRFCKKDVEDRKVKLGHSGRRKATREGIEIMENFFTDDFDVLAKEVVGKFKIKKTKNNSEK